MTHINPPRLQKGDKVAIVSPSTGLPHLFPWVYERGLQRIKDVLGLEPVEFPSATMSSEDLAANPKIRADDINAAFRDPSIKAIIASIGGNDQIRILPYLNKERIKANPKIFMGYSDCTNLHIYLWKLGIISYYGGAVMTQFAMGPKVHDYTIDYMKRALFDSSIGQIHPSPVWTDVDLDWEDKANLDKSRPMYQGMGWLWHNHKQKIIEGRLFGGCLEVLDLHLSVKRYLPTMKQFEDMILYLETSEEMATDGFVYRFIGALGELGILQKLKAILMGYPKAEFCGKVAPEGREAYRVNQQNAVIAALKDYDSNVPVVFNLNFGHTDPQIIIPNGARASIDGITKKITLCT